VGAPTRTVREGGTPIVAAGAKSVDSLPAMSKAKGSTPSRRGNDPHGCGHEHVYRRSQPMTPIPRLRPRGRDRARGAPLLPQHRGAWHETTPFDRARQWQAARRRSLPRWQVSVARFVYVTAIASGRNRRSCAGGRRRSNALGEGGETLNYILPWGIQERGRDNCAAQYTRNGLLGSSMKLCLNNTYVIKCSSSPVGAHLVWRDI